MANNSKENIEIPGYYWDNITRRYYRDDPVNPRPKPKKFHSMTASNLNTKSASSSRHLLDILNKRELGFGKSSFEELVVTLNFQDLQCIKEIKSNAEYPETLVQMLGSDVTFLKGGVTGVFLEESYYSSSVYSLRHKMHFFSPTVRYPPLTCCLSSTYSTVDLCEGLESSNNYFVLVVSSNSSTWRLQKHINSSTAQNVFLEFPAEHKSDSPIWCCNTNDFTKRFIYGKINNVVVCSFYTNATLHKKRVQGEVRSLQFDKQGNLIYAGLHTGHIEALDLRANDKVFRIRLHNRGIDETVLVSEEKQLICGAFDGRLCKFDLRTRTLVNEYDGHVHSPHKVPFSINEPNNLLCATGTDNVTRLWCLRKGGDPINCIQPPTKGTPCRSWLVSDGYKCLLYQYQRSNTYIYGNSSFEFSPDSTFECI